MALITSVAVVAATFSTARGMYVQQERYTQYYAKHVNENNFFSNANPLAVASPGDRVNTFEPSLTERSYLDRIDFPQQDRPVETRIYTGLIDVPYHRGGDYLFRLTSDDASHLFLDGQLVIDNGGVHAPVTKVSKLRLKGGEEYHMQLWWGNNAMASSLKLEFCKINRSAEMATELAELLSGEIVGGISGDLFSDEDLASADCNYVTDLSKLFAKHDDALTVQRCDFKGYFRDDPDWFPQHPNGSDKQLTRWLPDGCVEEAGGVIAVNARDKGVDACTNTSFTFTTRIAARATGLHTFWVESDDGASLYIGGKKIVDNAGYHAPQWKKGSVYLRKGAKKTLQVYYGNANFQGMLNVMWEDTLTDAPQQSLLPIMV